MSGLELYNSLGLTWQKTECCKVSVLLSSFSSAACGNRAVKWLWMTEVCTMVSLLIVVCLHAFGPRTTAMARGTLTAQPWVRAVCWKATLSLGPSSVELCVLFMAGYPSLQPLLLSCLSAFACVVMCVDAHMRGGWSATTTNRAHQWL